MGSKGGCTKPRPGARRAVRRACGRARRESAWPGRGSGRRGSPGSSHGIVKRGRKRGVENLQRKTRRERPGAGGGKGAASPAGGRRRRAFEPWAAGARVRRRGDCSEDKGH